MKRYLLASVLSFGLLVATNQSVVAQDDTDEDVDVEEEVEEEAVEEEETDEPEENKGTIQNPYLIGELGEIEMRTNYYHDPFSRFSMSQDGSEMAMEESELALDDQFMADLAEMFSMDSDMRSIYPPYYDPMTYEGTAHLEFTEVLRGDEALDYLNARNFYDYSTGVDDLEWAVFNFTFEWAESDDPNSIHPSNYEFTTFDITGVSINANDYYTYFDGAFEQNEMYVGGVLNGTFAKLVPADEPFMIRFGDNYTMQHTFFKFE
ncbi:hypothetical protein [Aliicoccus persicus]|uniref:Uncharacterized protein n=1 Tax=Aliicoccus persicus TaxID=930138 RepID=A0A662Z1W4_9STAP|nr:hypothetical protein [Aliicoccus persicus]SEV91552.1 hypothetical protein SAMN05192557_0744 [Aliicoccus persicus]